MPPARIDLFHGGQNGYQRTWRVLRLLLIVSLVLNCSPASIILRSLNTDDQPPTSIVALAAPAPNEPCGPVDVPPPDTSPTSAPESSPTATPALSPTPSPTVFPAPAAPGTKVFLPLLVQKPGVATRFLQDEPSVPPAIAA